MWSLPSPRAQCPRARGPRLARAAVRPLGALGAIALLALQAGCTQIAEKTGTLFKQTGEAVAGVVGGAPETPRVEIRVRGIEGKPAENIRALLGVAAEPCDAPEWRIERLVAAGREEAAQALRAFGYYEPEISLQAAPGETCWTVQVEVSAGERVKVSAVDVSLEGPGRAHEEFVRRIQGLPLAVGEPLRHADYQAAKSAIEGFALEHGYLEGRFVTSEMRVDVAARAAALRLVYDTGPRYRFGPLAIEQEQEGLTLDLIERLIAYQPDAPYDAAALLDVQRRLAESGYFAHVDVRPRLDSPQEQTIPVEVRLTPRRRHGFSAGAGLTTDAGPRLRLGYENRRVNRRGHRWAARSSTSLIEQDLSTEYRIPLADPGTEWLTFQAGARLEETETSESETLKLGVQQTKVRWGDWLETRFFSATREDFVVGRQSGTATLFVPGLSFAGSEADDRLRPTAGYRLLLEGRGTHEAIGSDVSFLRLFASAGWVRGLPWGGARILARTDLGTLAVGTFEALPPSQRFFTGGDTTVRGYEFQSLGPEDDSGEVVGGRYLAVMSLEYEHPLNFPGWSVAGFIDAGNAFDHDTENQGLKVGVGTGVRWQSPIGPMRLDLAHPLDDEQLFRVHLRLGPDL